MSRRLYIGKLPPDARSDDVSKLFEGFGKMVDCRVMTGFGFVEFETEKDAEDAMMQFNGKDFMGNNIVVEFAKESRPRRAPDGDRYGDRGPPRGSRRPQGHRVLVTGISRDTSWQDLKDFGREAGSVSFSDIDRDAQGQGILEYLARDDAERAVRELDGKDLRGNSVRVNLSESRDQDGPDNFRPRDDRRRSEYNRDGPRDRYPPPRRDRSRSPRRDRSRSPPPKNGRGHYDPEYDHRRGGGGGGDRGGRDDRDRDRRGSGRGGSYRDDRPGPGPGRDDRDVDMPPARSDRDGGERWAR